LGFDGLFALAEGALENKKDYPDKDNLGYKSLVNLYVRLKDENRKFDSKPWRTTGRPETF
jgi:hypothetical protein